MVPSSTGIMNTTAANVSDAQSSNDTSADVDAMSLDIIYTTMEVLVAVVAVIGNALTVMVFAVDRKLRRLTNYYIVALAVADFLVGVLGIPFAILTSVGLPGPQYPCLLMLSTLLVLCTTSIFCLVAVSVDRYWAILHPLKYSRVMTARIARYIILGCWLAGTFIGFLPLMGWHGYGPEQRSCQFTEVMNYDYLVFLYFATIVGPGILMAIFYTHIYTVVLKQTKLSVKSEHGTLRQIAAHEPKDDTSSAAGSSGRQRPRFLLGRSQSRNQMGDKLDSRTSSTNTNIASQVTHASRREVKAAKSLSIIVLFFMVSWFPLYTINCVQKFCPDCQVPPDLMKFTIILSHLNSAINPLLYAYHMKDFRMAIKVFTLHRILRRPLPYDYVFNRSLVSPHHSTLYRVNMTQPNHNNLHTPHAHNTPLTGSPSPLAGTPRVGYRSRTSTMGSYGPWPPPHLSCSPASAKGSGVIATTELSTTPEAVRPRAATINTHTAPATVKKTVVAVPTSQTMAEISPTCPVPAHSLMAAPGDVSDIVLQVDDIAVSVEENSDARGLKENNSGIRESPTEPTVKEIPVSNNVDGGATPGPSAGVKSEAAPEHQHDKSASDRHTQSPTPRHEVTYLVKYHKITKPLHECNTCANKPSEYLQTPGHNHVNSDTKPLPNGSAGGGHQVLDPDKPNYQNDDTSLCQEELRSLCDSSKCVVRPPNDPDPRPPDPRLTHDLYRCIPKLLRREPDSAKAAKNTGSWWPGLARQSSYHDLSAGSKTKVMRRTWSACGTMNS